MNEALELANDKVDELYKRLAESGIRETKTLLRLSRIRNIIESGMNNEQKLIYITNLLKEEL